MSNSNSRPLSDSVRAELKKDIQLRGTIASQRGEDLQRRTARADEFVSNVSV